MEAETAGRQRIDKWLWHARVVRTRTLAQDLIRSGHVRVNRLRVETASHRVSSGDVLTIAQAQRLLVLVVKGFAERRGPASAARLLYDDQSPSAPGTPLATPDEGEL